MRTLGTLGTFALVLALPLGLTLGVGLCACERERVDVADLDDDASIPSETRGDASVPSFPTIDATPDEDATSCGNPPLVGVCASCPNGYLVVAGKSTCTCCD